MPGVEEQTYRRAEKEGFVMYKSQLQEYAQKAGLMHPTYDHVKEGASHEPRFKSTVWVNNQSYESAPGFSTLRSAEHAAAKVALDFLQKSQTSGVVPSPVHESGLCKNLLQEYAQKNGYPLPQYKLMRQGVEHPLVYTATVEIAGVSYSGGVAKSKKEAEIKAARTALLAIQATQPAMGLPAMEPRPLLPQSQPGQIANFVKYHPKRTKRGRLNSPFIEEPLAIRMKQCLGHVPGPVQLPQIHQVHEMPQVSHVCQVPQVPQVSQVYQVPQVFQVPQSSHVLQGPLLNQVAHTHPVGYSGQNVMPVEWNQELGVYTRAAEFFSEPMQVVNAVSQDTAMKSSEWRTGAAGMEPTLDSAMTQSEWGTRPADSQGTQPTPDTKVLNGETTALANTETAVVEADGITVKAAESVKVQQAPVTIDAAKDSQVLDNIPTNSVIPKELIESPAITALEETVPSTEEVHASPASTSQVLLVQPQVSSLVKEELPASQVDQVSAPINTKTSESTTPQNSVVAQELILANGELQAEILSAMVVGSKSEAA